jgi:hypothetical protein
MKTKKLKLGGDYVVIATDIRMDDYEQFAQKAIDEGNIPAGRFARLSMIKEISIDGKVYKEDTLEEGYNEMPGRLANKVLVHSNKVLESVSGEDKEEEKKLQK